MSNNIKNTYTIKQFKYQIIRNHVKPEENNLSQQPPSNWDNNVQNIL